MSDNKPTSTFYNLLGGINQKASEYSVGKAQFLNLRNMDFDVPNALNKRPGSTQAVSTGTSGPINSIFEFIKLTGESYVVAGSDTAMFYLAGGAFTLLDTGWSNGQPTDMLTFVNRLWMANGQNYKWWDGTSVFPAGLPIQTRTLSYLSGSDATMPAWSVFGVTMNAWAGPTTGQRAVLIASYANVRKDGYVSPSDIYNNATIVSPFNYQKDGILFGSYIAWGGLSEWAGGGAFGNSIAVTMYGFTASSSLGLSGYAVFLALDVWTGITANLLKTYAFNGGSGRLLIDRGPTSESGILRPDADLLNFKHFTTVPYGTFTLSIEGITLPWPVYSNQMTSFSLMTFDFFSTYVPRYLEVNNNIPFLSGFSVAPSNVQYMGVGAPEYTEPDWNFEVRTNDGDRVTGTKAFKGQVIIFKQNSFHKAIGDSPENLELIEISTQFGCLSNKSIVEFNQSLAWLDRRGIITYNGAGWDILSYPVEDFIRRMNISAAIDNAVGVNLQDRNQLWFGIPIDSSTQNNITLVYDYLINAWTVFDGFNPASFAQAKSGLSRPTVWRGNYSGMVYYHGATFYGDNGQGITCLGVPHWDKNKENETWIWRRVFLDLATASGLTGTITGRLFSNYNTSTVQGTFAMYQDAFQSRAEFGVMGKAVTMEFAHYSASLPLLINGFSWAKRFLRNV